jgi:hypothetical protein
VKSLAIALEPMVHNGSPDSFLRPIGHEQAVHLVIGARQRGVRVGRDDLFAPNNPSDA